MKNDQCQRLRVTIRGAVQGVGFRPFVYRLARAAELTGWIRNSSEGVYLEAEGAPARLENFLLRLQRERPPRSFIQSLEASYLDPVGYADFEIRESRGGEKTAQKIAWSCRISPLARIAGARYLIRPTGATVIRSPTAPTAAALLDHRGAAL